MYLAAMEKASWSLFPQSLEQDLAQGEDFADSNQAGVDPAASLQRADAQRYFPVTPTAQMLRKEMAATMRRGYKELLKEAVDKLKDRLAAG